MKQAPVTTQFEAEARMKRQTNNGGIAMRLRKMFCLALVTFFPFHIYGADIAVFRTEATNMPESHGSVIGIILAQKYAEVSGRSVAGPSSCGKALDEAGGDFSKAARGIGASEYILSSAVALYEKIMIETGIYDESGALSHSARMTAVTMDDLEEVCDRLARALHGRTSVKGSVTLDNVGVRETQEKNRFFTEKIMGVKTAMIGAFPKGTEVLPMIAIGYNLRMESEKFFAEFGASALIPAEIDILSDMSEGSGKGYGGVMMELGASYYLSNNPAISPYVGGGLSPRYYLIPGSIGMAPYVQAGLMLMRFSSMRIYTDLRVAQNVFAVSEYKATYDPDAIWEKMYSRTETGRYLPLEVGLQFGIGW